MTIALIIAVIWLAYSNGANDNFKGVATLYGSGTATFERARLWATATTLAGSIVSVLLAATLAKRFSGSGLVPDDVASSTALLVSVGAAGAATIFLATILGMPTSTTHALTGALVGISILVNDGSAPLGRLWSGFLLPLLASPLMAVVGAGGLYLVLRRVRRALGITRETCVCLGPQRRPAPVALTAGAVGIRSHPLHVDASNLRVSIGESTQCVERYAGTLVGIDAQRGIDVVHFASAGAVCFARAVNDTPKIAALLMVGGAISGSKLVLVAAAIAVGGVLQARRVAETMSNGITSLNAGQGLTGNLVTSILVIGASRLGLPVSTTHVSVGSIFGIGVAGGSARWRTIVQIGTTWVTTLPLGAVLGVASYLLLTRPDILPGI